MNKGFAFLISKTGPILMVFLSLTLMGCPKKVSPVSGSAGLSEDQGSKPFSGNRDLTPQEEDLVFSQSETGSSIEKRGPGTSSDGGSSFEQEREELALKETPLEAPTFVPSDAEDRAPGFSETIYFDYDMASIRPDAIPLLQENARWLRENRNVKVQIEGHGDERGTNEYNLALGERRARSVVRYLVNSGLDRSRFSFITYGEEMGVCSEKTESCYQKNRRTRFVMQE
ncbi:MAG: OmpA family protein [Nitrospiria bacterium]